MKRKTKTKVAKPMGRPSEGRTVQLQIRLTDDEVARVEAWRDKQERVPGMSYTRSWAVRRLLEIGLETAQKA